MAELSLWIFPWIKLPFVSSSGGQRLEYHSVGEDQLHDWHGAAALVPIPSAGGRRPDGAQHCHNSEHSYRYCTRASYPNSRPKTGAAQAIPQTDTKTSSHHSSDSASSSCCRRSKVGLACLHSVWRHQHAERCVHTGMPWRCIFFLLSRWLLCAWEFLLLAMYP